MKPGVARLFFFLLIPFTFPLFAQEKEGKREVEHQQQELELALFLENLSDAGVEETDYAELSDALALLLKHPLNLNTADFQALKKLFFLSPLQISNFLEHRHTNGKLVDLLELQGIAGFEPETIIRILPYVTLHAEGIYSKLNPQTLYQSAYQEVTTRYSRVLQQKKGFQDLPGSRYLGSPDQLLFRYKYTHTDLLSAALLLKKDAGEQLFQGKPAIDHLSGNLSFFKLKRINKLVIGDYSLQFGQGLSLWSGFSFGKGPDVTSVASKDIGLRPYSSSNESSFFRGLATELNLSALLRLTLFVSFRKRDASLKLMPDDRFSLTTIGTSGLHRTKNELKNRKTLSQQVYGSVLQYQIDQLGMGIVAYRSDYSHSFITGPQLYKKYAFTGKELYNTGFHYNYTFRNIYFYGEAAKSFPGGMATLNGAMASISAKVAMVILYRDYNRDYHNFFSQTIGEATETRNEKGIYAGINYLPAKHWKLSLYFDYFRFPWLRYRVDAPSSGFETLTQATYTPSKTFRVNARFSISHQQQNPDKGSLQSGLATIEKSGFRMEWNWQPQRKFSLRQRAEITHYQKGKEKIELGYLVYQDVNYQPLSSKASGNLRLAYFHTASYQSRIYAYENDVLNSSSSGNYSGKGIRSYVNLRYRLSRKSDLWARYSIYFYPGQELLGSGLDEIKGPVKSELKLQFRQQF